jgi:hypothetical protein
MNNNAIEIPGKKIPTKGTKIDGKYEVVILYRYENKLLKNIN